MTPETTRSLLEVAERLAHADPEGDGQEYWEVVRELHRRGGTDVCERAVHWCRSEQYSLRSLGASVLAQLGRSEGFPFRAASLPVLSGLLQDPVPLVVASAVHALGHLDVADSAPLLQLLHHPSADVRWALASCLGSLNAPGGRATLIELSRDADADVRDWATFGLGSLTDADSPELRAALIARLDDGDDDARGEALVGLAVRGDERVLPYIERELQRDSVGDLALDAAGQLGDRRLLPHLRAMAGRFPHDADVRRAIELCAGAPVVE